MLTDALPRYLLLDMDDTLLADSVNAYPSWQIVCQRFAPDLGDLEADRVLVEIENMRRWYWSDTERHRQGRLNLTGAWEEIVAGAFKELKIEAPEAVRKMALAHAAERVERMQLFPKTLETLSCFRERGLRLALVTNGHGTPQREKIGRFGLAPFFDTILIEGEFGVGKPDERVYRHVLSQWGATPAEAWMVGDNLEWDVGAPQRLGIYGVWIDLTGKGLPEGHHTQPDRIIRSLVELVEAAP